MLFNSPVFLIGFLPVALAGFLLADRFGGPRAAQIWLLLASGYFYAWWRPDFLPLLFGSILANYGFGLALRQWPVRLWLAAGVGCNLGLLCFFKYGAFLGLTWARGIFLPLGISFFTFQQIMFLVDSFAGDILAVSLLDYACFIGFFPHLIAGPIVRPGDIIPQFRALRPLADWRTRLAEGLEIFLLGLAKKVVLADSLASFADPGFAAAARHDPISLIEAWVALLAYALQIYFDFSGYSDMAIGLARMFGIEFPRNFRSPYQAQNIGDFWTRWNITLSFFLRDYLYIPLGGNRRGEGRRIFNVLATMLLGGLWHGAAWRFVLWGGLHGLFLVVHGWSARTGCLLPRLAARVITLAAVVLAWVPFRAENFAAAMAFYRGLFGFNGIVIPALLARFLPFPVPMVTVLPDLGDARTFSLPLGLLLIGLGWFIVLAMPDLHVMTRARRNFALLGSFALSIQAVFFAPAAIPFLYFQF